MAQGRGIGIKGGPFKGVTTRVCLARLTVPIVLHYANLSLPPLCQKNERILLYTRFPGI